MCAAVRALHQLSLGGVPPRASAPRRRHQRFGTSRHLRPWSRPPATPFCVFARRSRSRPRTPSRCPRADALIGSERSGGWRRGRSDDHRRDASDIGALLGQRARRMYRSFSVPAVDERKRRLPNNSLAGFAVVTSCARFLSCKKPLDVRHHREGVLAVGLAAIAGQRGSDRRCLSATSPRNPEHRPRPRSYGSSSPDRHCV